MTSGVGPELRDRLLAPCAIHDDAGALVAVNIGAVVRRLLLFEDYILDWYGKGELAALTEVFGGAGLVTLLESGALKLRAEAGVMGQIGQTDLMKPSGSREPLPRGTYVVASVMPSAEDRQRHISERLGEIREMQLPKRTSQAVRLAAVKALVPLPENAGRPALTNLSADVEVAHHAFGVAAATELSKSLGKAIRPREFTISFEQVDVDTYAVETDIAARIGVNAEEEHKVAERALIAVASLNHRIEEMASYGCVMGFTDSDLPVLESKLNVLAATISPETQEARFDRVVTLAGLPDLGENVEIDADRLLKLRDTEECREFRAWLRTLDNATDAEIQERVANLSARVAGVFHGTAGKAVRFILSTGVSFIPGAGGIAGPALDALDTFVLEKLINEPGPVTFITRDYPSIFK